MRAAAVAVLLLAAACGGDATADRPDLCDAAEAQLQALSDLYDAAVAGLPEAELDELVAQTERAGRDLQAAVPDDLAGDAALLAATGDRLAAALADEGPGARGVPESVLDDLRAPAYVEASTRVRQALAEECPGP